MPKNKTISYDKRLYERLQDPLEAREYLKEALEDGDPKVLGKAIEDIIKSRKKDG